MKEIINVSFIFYSTQIYSRAKKSVRQLKQQVDTHGESDEI